MRRPDRRPRELHTLAGRSGPNRGPKGGPDGGPDSRPPRRFWIVPLSVALANLLAACPSLAEPRPARSEPGRAVALRARPGELTLFERERLPRDRRRERLFHQAATSDDTEAAAQTLADLLRSPGDCFIADPFERVAKEATRRDVEPDGPGTEHREREHRGTGDESTGPPRPVSLKSSIRELLALRSDLRAAPAQRRLAPPAAFSPADLIAAGCPTAAAARLEQMASDPLSPLSRSERASLSQLAAELCPPAAIRTAAIGPNPSPGALAGPASHSFPTRVGNSLPLRPLPPAASLPWPRWRIEHGTTNDREQRLREWESDRSESQGSFALPLSPVVVGDQVIVLLDGRLVSRSIATGELRWTLPVDRSAERKASDRSGASGDLFNARTSRISASAERIFLLTETVRSSGLVGSTVVGVDIGGESPQVCFRRNLGDDLALCPPLPTRHGLMCLVRGRTRLRLLCLDRTGQTRWDQPLALDESRPAGFRAIRSWAADLDEHGGLVICSTRVGMTVAVDAADGTLRWVDFDPEALPSANGRPTLSVTRLRGEPAFPTPLVCAGDRVLLLPPESSRLHCVDLRTGRAIWREHRRRATDIVGVVGDRVVVSGERHLRAVSVDDGRTLWTRRLPTPSGRSVIAGNTIIVPQESGMQRMLSVVDGVDEGHPGRDAARRIADADCSVRGRRLGHLLLVREGLLSCSATHLARFDHVDRRLAELPPTAAGDLERACIDLALGRVDTAVERLERFPVVESDDLNDRLTQLRREALFVQLHATGGQHPAAVTQLMPLVQTPEDSGRLLLHRLSAAVAADDENAVGNLLATLEDLPAETFCKQDGSTQRPLVVAGSILDDASSRVRSALVGQTATTDDRDRCLAVLSRRSITGPLWLDRAADDLAAGRYQAAELALLQAERTGAPDVVKHATTRRAAMYAQLGRFREAARLFGSSETIDLASLSRATRRALAAERARLRTTSMPTGGTTVAVDTESVDPAAAWYDGVRWTLTPPPDAGYDLVDVERGEGTARSRRLVVIDRTTTRRIAECEIPKQFWMPSSRTFPTCGHLMPLGARESVGLSLLENRTLWTQASTISRLKAQVAVADPLVTVFQNRSHLRAVDTLTGTVLWTRDDLDRRSGLASGRDHGVASSVDRLVLFDPDGSGFTRVSLRSGALLGRGRLEPLDRTLRRTEHSCGLRIAYVARVEGRWRYRVRDLARPAEPLLLDEPAAEQGPIEWVSPQHIVIVGESDEIVLFDVRKGCEVSRTQLDRPWPAGQPLVAALGESDLLVHLPHSQGFGGQHPLGSTDIRLPHRNLTGGLASIDRLTGELNWRIGTGRATLLDTTATGCPVLLLAARVREQEHHSEYRVRLDVIDRRTGERVRGAHGIPNTKWVRWDYDAPKRRVSLTGIEARVDIQIGGPTHEVAAKKTR